MPSRSWAAPVLLALTALAVALRLRALGSALWLDEAQAVSIAHAPLSQLPGLLRLDGSPPLYYALLHVWMAVAGSGEARLHLLSVGLAALAVPAGWAAARAVATPRAAWICAGLLAVNPMLTEYADQARMYTLLATASLVALAALAGVLVHRRRAAVPLLAVATAAVLYTHNWGFFLLAGFGAAALAVWLTTGRPRALARDAALGLGGALVLYAPWVPHLVAQARHTGAPWSIHPTLHDVVQATGHAVGDAGPAAVLLVVGGSGLVALARRRPRVDPDRTGLLVAATVATVTLATALAYTQVALAWAPRYLALLAGPFVVLASIGLAQMGGLGVAAALVAAAFSVGAPHTSTLANKTNVAQLARAMSPRLRAGDLVVSTQPEQVPALARYLGGGLRYATPEGLVRRPAVMDWRDALARMRRASPRRDLYPLVRGLPAGAHVLLVDPSTSPQGLASRWARVVRRAKQRWTRDLRTDAQLVPEKRFVRDEHAHLAGASAVLLRRVSDPVRGDPPAVRVTVGARRGRAIPRTFLGLSVEWDSVDAYAGAPGRRHAGLLALLGELRRARRAPLALRIGGDSGDQAWWNPSHRRRPRTVLQDVTPATLQSIAWLARGLGGPVTLGLNLALRNPGNARALARAALGRLPRGALRTLEIGNEPDLYSRGRTFHVPGKVHRRLRKRVVYTPQMYRRDVARYLPVLAPVLPSGARFGVASFAGPAWWSRLPGMLRAWGTRRVAILAHLYALASCTVRTPTSAWLESPAASRGVVAKLRPIAGFAGRHRLPLRVTELNSAACGGRRGLSDHFGAALWLADTLFALAHRGVAQADVHTWDHARYAPFVLAGDGVRPRPPFAGMLAFARAAPSGSRLAAVRVRGGHGLRAWATVDARGVRRVLLIAPSAVRAVLGRGCSRVWRATARGASARRTCSSSISLPAASLAVVTRPAPAAPGRAPSA